MSWRCSTGVQGATIGTEMSAGAVWTTANLKKEVSMKVFTARIEVSDDYTYAEIEDAKASAVWKEKGPGGMYISSDTDLHGKCGGCIYFQAHPGKRGGQSRGFCTKGGSGLCRTYKACRMYQERNDLNGDP